MPRHRRRATCLRGRTNPREVRSEEMVRPRCGIGAGNSDRIYPRASRTCPANPAPAAGIRQNPRCNKNRTRTNKLRRPRLSLRARCAGTGVRTSDCHNATAGACPRPLSRAQQSSKCPSATGRRESEAWAQDSAEPGGLLFRAIAISSLPTCAVPWAKLMAQPPK